ncbi:MAG TPA: SsrA-binding protein, partial [Polyangiaceae bacterium]|nr:SsrA-binding protein [Polyangiaceae bacterium]
KAIDRGGMTVVATRLYFRNGKAKIELAIARGKRKTDKREAIKDRDAAREAQILMREKNR